MNFVAITTRSRLAAMAAEVVADDRLGVAVRVAVGGIDEVAAPVEVAVDDRLRRLGRCDPQPQSSPKVIAPRQSGLTRRPEWPSVT